jgi:hypothetical protein
MAARVLERPQDPGAHGPPRRYGARHRRRDAAGLCLPGRARLLRSAPHHRRRSAAGPRSSDVCLRDRFCAIRIARMCFLLHQRRASGAAGDAARNLSSRTPASTYGRSTPPRRPGSRVACLTSVWTCSARARYRCHSPTRSAHHPPAMSRNENPRGWAQRVS